MPPRGRYLQQIIVCKTLKYGIKNKDIGLSIESLVSAAFTSRELGIKLCIRDALAKAIY
jgi:hypothetical protein